MAADRVIGMRFGLDVPVDGPYADPRLLARLAGEAERAGWDGFFTQDVLSLPDPIADPWSRSPPWCSRPSG